MGDKTGISWTDATWNPVVGCSVVSPGCTNCYAMKMAARLERMGTAPHYAGTTQASNGGAVWTGKLALAPEHILTAPLRWRRPRRIFVNSMGDLFHKDVPDAWIDKVFAVMAMTPWHTYQVLTKRSARMRAYTNDMHTPERILEAFRLVGASFPDVLADLMGHIPTFGRACQDVLAKRLQGQPSKPMLGRKLLEYPYRNVWLGVSAEDQQRADERVPDLLATPAAVRFVSAEPLLGPIDFTVFPRAATGVDRQRPGFDRVKEFWFNALNGEDGVVMLDGSVRMTDPGEVASLDWIIVGGESGPRARPMHPQWACDIRDQCAAAGVAFFMKQMSGPHGRAIKEIAAFPADLQVREMPHAG